MSLWGRNNGGKKRNKTVNIFLGFFFVVNFCLGTGFLGIPYSFFYSGFIAAIPTLLFIAVIGWANANYLLEVMARAQALEHYDKFQNPVTDSDTTDSEIDQKGHLGSLLQQKSASSINSHPRFEITIKRKFEIPELCEIFVNKYLKYTYLILLSIYIFLAAWSFSTVAASAWAINIPFRNFGAVEKCAEHAFTHNVLPSGGCLYAYYFCLTLFGVIVVTLSLFDLKEQAIVQLSLGVLRFVTVVVIVLYCIVRLAEGGDPCMDLNANSSLPMKAEIRPTVLKFDPSGWVLTIPVFAYAFLFHTGIASLTHPIKEKKYLHWLMVAMYLAATFCYMSLGVIVPLWFRASIQETCTLNWAVFTYSGHSVPIRILSYYLIIFPSLDVVSAYPLVNHVIVNNLYILITGHDTSKKPKFKFDWFLRKFLRFTMAVLPILAAFGVANLIYILKYAGLIAFIAYTFPVGLQLCSIYVCKKVFATSFISINSRLSVIKEKSLESEGDDEERKSNGNEVKPLAEGKERETLLESRDMSSKEKQGLYMTPYSSHLISHPLAVWIVGALGLALFIFAFSSLFIHPHKVTCELLDDEF